MLLRELLENYSDEELKAWLQAGFQDNEWDSVVFDLQPTIPAQIQTVFGELRARDQDKLRRAVTRAIGEWTPEHPRVLARLCELAAYVRPTRTAALLRDIVVNVLAERQNDERYGKLTSIVIATLSGLVPMPEAIEAVEILYFSDHIPPRYAAQLLHGMISAAPLEFPRYLPRFVNIAARDEKLFRLEIVLESLIEDITPTKFAEHHKSLDPHTADLLDFLMRQNGIYYDRPRRRMVSGVDQERAIIADVESKTRDRDAQQDLAGYLGFGDTQEAVH